METNKDKILDKLSEVWSKRPELRFMQLLFAITKQSGTFLEMFYLEDNRLLKMIDKFNEKNNNNFKFKCECGSNLLFTGMELMSYPIQYEHECKNCGMINHLYEKGQFNGSTSPFERFLHPKNR